MAISFDETDDYYSIADAANLTLPDGDWCIGIWTKVDDNASNRYQYLISSRMIQQFNSFNLFLGEAASSDPNIWQAYVEDGDGTRKQLYSTTAPGADGKWRLIICQRVTADNEVQLWFCERGSVAVKEDSVADTDLGASDGEQWDIGRRRDADADRYYGSIACEFFKGDFSLTQAEITALGVGSVRLLGKAVDAHYPMIRADTTLKNLYGDNDATRQSVPVTVAHAPIIYPAPPHVAYVSAAVIAIPRHPATIFQCPAIV